MTVRSDAQKRAMVARMEREDLEDQHLRILEENAILKAHGRKQEEKIKKMATKLIRLVNDRKKQGAANKRSARDIGLEETIENQQDFIRRLEKENESLKQKLMVAQQQMQAQGKKTGAYSKVPARIDNGRPKKREGSPDTLRSHGKPHDRSSIRGGSPTPGRYGHSLLEEARNENHHLQQQIRALQDQIASMQTENDTLHSELQNYRSAHENDILKFKEHVTSTQRSTVNDNIELIKVQRQMKEKSNNLTAMEGRFQDLQRNYNQLRSSYERVIHEVDRLKSQLLDEENRSILFQNQLKQGDSSQRKASQMHEHIMELEKEVEILKEANEKLVDSAFDQEKEHQWRQLERKLRVQIAQLEAAIKSDVADKNEYLAKMENERGFATRLHSDSRKAYDESTRLRNENHELRERLKLYTLSDDIVDIDELREALAKVRQRRHAAAQKEKPDFLHAIDDDNKDPETLFLELQAQHAETIQELEKTREMLLMQHKINKDYQIEVESVTTQIDDVKREYELKLDRFARLLDARAARIKKLESQLHDVAYGTKQFKYLPEEDTVGYEEELDDTIQLERGENLFEIHISKLSLSKEALIALDDREPALFVTYAFYDYELVSTPILKSASPLYDFTAQFTVKVDDLFLHHIQKESTIFEVHQALGVEHSTIAACKVKFNQLLDKPQGKLHSSVALTGNDGSNYGSLDFWVRLRVPMEQAIRLYRERTKALGYLSANTATTQKALDSMNSDIKMLDSVDNTNQLLIQIISCNHVQARREGTQPSIYCVYKFFDFADHDTVIIPHSNNPHFDDRQAYPVQMNLHLDTYLKSEKLVIYVFDDTDPELSSYLGKAVIDLIPLAHNKVIKAPFQLGKSNNEENGTIEVSLRWQLVYTPPGGGLAKDNAEEEEREILETQKLVSKPPVTPKKRSMIGRLAKPFSSSTPKPTRDNAEKPTSDDTVTSQPLKKVSIIEPVKDTPVPLTRSVKFRTDVVEVEDTVEDGEEDIEEESQGEDVVDTKKREDEELEEEIADDVEETSEEIPKKEKAKSPPKDVIEALEDYLDYEEDEESFVSDQLGSKTETKTPTPPQSPPKDKTKDDKDAQNEDDYIEEDIEEIPDDAEDQEESDKEEESVIMVREKGSPEPKEEKHDSDVEEQEEGEGSDAVTISINHLTLATNTSVWDDVEQMFVEYDFLGSLEEMPNSVPLSKDKKINISFQSKIEMDPMSNQEKCSLLSNMVETGQSSFKVTVVSEPVNDEDEECDEIGSVSVDLAEILSSGRNMIDQDLDVVNLKEPHDVIGKLNVDVKALHVLRKIQQELKAKMQEHA